MKSVIIEKEGDTMLEQRIVPELLVELEARIEFWKSRAVSCYDLGIPEMVAARTMRFKRLGDPSNTEEFVVAYREFRNSVMDYLTSECDFSKVHDALELFVGSGVFYQELIKLIPNLVGIDFVPENLDYIQSVLNIAEEKLLCVPAHWIATHAGFSEESLDMVLAFNGFIHQPDPEFKETLLEVQRILRPGGFLVVGEMLENDRPRERPINKGTWYRKLATYMQNLPLMKVVKWSDPINNDGDNCRIVLFSKM